MGMFYSIWENLEFPGHDKSDGGMHELHAKTMGSKG